MIGFQFDPACLYYHYFFAIFRFYLYLCVYTKHLLRQQLSDLFSQVDILLMLYYF
nr:MAG TPA: hypothetical protein [Caudoviricetes sp.]